MSILDTGVKICRNVDRYVYGAGALAELGDFVEARRREAGGSVIFLVDGFFADKELLDLPVATDDLVRYVSAAEELTTDYVDGLLADLRASCPVEPAAIVGIGGGTTMDAAKAVSNLFTNGGKAADYQGWDLVKVPGIYKIGVPTLSGTGAEATRTCVMVNSANGLKLGMNSDFTVFNTILLDPELSATVPRDQYFYTGMDAYVHCIEAAAGSYRNAIGDAFGAQALELAREVFMSEDMMAMKEREKMMVASYLGGCSIAASYVGVVHPLSAGLSVVLGVPHCLANCVTMRAVREFYPREYDEFWQMANKQGIEIPEGICRDLSDEQHQALYQSSVVHDKPLTNALGEDFRSILTPDKVRELYLAM